MSYSKKLLLSVSSGAILAMTGFAAQAAEKEANPIEEIVVTGVASAHGERKQDAAFAITTANEDQMREAVPSSAADLAKLVPGLFAEVTGGVSGPNIEVRGFPTAGDAPWVTYQLDGLPVFPVATLSFLDTSTQVRLDDSVARMEASVGGPSVLWGAGQPGATINLTQKNGLDNQEGSARFTTGTGALYRFDGYYGGQVAPNWYASVGGFYRTDKGVRDTQYPNDQGYQVEATVVHTIDDGKLMFYGRKTDDNNQFYTPIPLIAHGSGTNTTISGYPGFNALTGTFFGNANRVVTIDTAPGSSLTMDQSRGRGIDTQIVGFDFDKKFAGFDISNKMSYMSGTTYSITQFTGDLPQTLGNFINGEVASANGNSAALAAAGNVAATGGMANFVSSGKAITNLNLNVIGIGDWYVSKALTAFQDEFRVSRQITDSNRLTIGSYVTSYTSHDIWYLGNKQLMTVEKNAQPIAVTLSNGVKATSPGGIFSSVGYAVNNSYDGFNWALIAADDWQITDKLKVTAGFRIEHENIDLTAENRSSGLASNSGLALYDYGASILNGTYSGYDHNWWAHAFNVGADYEIMKNLNAFVAYNQGYAMPTFDNIRDAGLAPYEAITHAKQVQGGIKTANELYSLYLTGFYTEFAGQPQSDRDSSGNAIFYLQSSESKGVEVEAAVRPFKGFEVDLSGDYQNGTYTAGSVGGKSIVGNDVARQPKLQFRVTPSYRITTPWGVAKIYATPTFVDDRWADNTNLQFMPSYWTLDLGASLLLDNGIDLTFSGTNVTNTLAITEGNSRVSGTSGVVGGVFLGRPLFGASYQASVALHF